MTLANSPVQMKQWCGVMSRKQSPLFREDALGSTSLVWTCRRPGVIHRQEKKQHPDRWLISGSSDYRCQHAWIIIPGGVGARMCQPSPFDPVHVCTCICLVTYLPLRIKGDLICFFFLSFTVLYNFFVHVKVCKSYKSQSPELLSLTETLLLLPETPWCNVVMSLSKTFAKYLPSG